jgi:glutathione peroxidase
MKRLLYLCVFLCGAMAWQSLFASSRSIYDIKVKSINGKEQSLSDYKGKVLLIVNTASGCGFTPQFKSLQELYAKYNSKGFVVLGFPSNDFGGQEAKSNKEIKEFCELNYKVSFPLFEKAVVKGQGKIPLFRFLTEQSEKSLKGEIDWNFEKFVVSREGLVKARFDSVHDPMSKQVTEKIESLLNEKGN